jgi:Uncharacterized conserved protein (DUF2075)
MNRNPWPRGSEWRKWDLHVHTPASHGFQGDWNGFIIQLGNADCDVVGINDYFSVAGYREVLRRIGDPGAATEGNKAYRDALEKLRSKILMPVVECRMTNVLMNKKGTGQRINFHLIFDPAIDPENIETFLKNQQVKDSSIGNRYSDSKFLLDGVSVDFNTITKALRTDGIFKDRFLIWLPYDEYGGIDGINPSTDKLFKENLIYNADNLRDVVEHVVGETPMQAPLDGNEWLGTGYKPTPTIIEAAQALYQGHRVEDITRSDAGAKNLSETATCLAEIIENTKSKQQKAICFVTGVPGAGKTLAGLNLVTLRTKAHEDEHAVFLSGNGPLVEVLREALARDEHAQLKEKGEKSKKSEATRKVKGFVQNIMHFRDASLVTAGPPIERVAVFDEAQRAWDASHLAKFMSQKKGQPNFQMSEPELLISVMDRHEDWCTIICLIGGGQEINAGEAGLTEWISALKRSFRNWKVFTSEQLTHRDYHWGQNLPALLEALDSRSLPALHLAVSVRSFRAEKLSEFVGSLVAGEAKEARGLYNTIKAAYPIALTRDLARARQWLRDRARGSERIGLVASSGASRLKPEGINVHEKIEATTWFLNGKDDVRSSYYMEDPATEFDIQGLELDWVGVCWDADFRAVDGRWQFHRFSGTRWQNVNDENRKIYLTNAYRVLLTRARQGMVIYIPKGDSLDATRLSEFYNGTAAFLSECGLLAL